MFFVISFKDLAMPIDIKHDTVEIALQKLKARENTLRQTEAIAGLGSWEVDLKTNKAIWSEESFKLYGYEYNEIKPSADVFLNHLLPEDRIRAKEALQRVIKSGKIETFEGRLKRDDGKIIDVILHAQTIYDEYAKPIKIIGTTQNITEIKKLKKHTQELAELLEHSLNEVYVVRQDNLKYLYVNDGACKATGYTKEEFLSKDVYDLNPFLTKNGVLELKQMVKNSNKDSLFHRTQHRRKDGSLYYVQSYIHPVKYNDIDAYVIFDTDISEIIELQLKHERQSKILEHIHDSVIAVDLDGKILSFNKGSTKLLNYTEDEIIGQPIYKIYSNENDVCVRDLLVQLKQKEEIENFEAYLVKKDGSKVICDISLSLLRDDDCKIVGVIGYSQDITDKKIVEAQLKEQKDKLEYLAHHDPLTNLPNRALFNDRLSQSIAYAQRNSKQFALLFVDLDQFKQINDSLGHDIGDKVLIEAAKRLKNSIRLEDTLSRLGGDEFTIILKDISEPHDVSNVCQKIIESIKKPIHIGTHSLYISASIGVSMYPKDSEAIEDLIKFADAAMYKAKEEGRDNFQFYSKEMTARAFERVVVENALRVAIENDEFIVYYQPQYNGIENRLIGMEALIRWKHPTMGLVPPSNFIPIAEESGLITQIDRIVMKKAMAQFVKWYKDGLNPGVLALNLAMKQLNEKDFLSVLIDTMNKLEFKSKWLELEVTESEIMNKPEQSIQTLYKLHDYGIELAIDDFGTGYSSLSYLRRLPLDKLKIDQSFIHDVIENSDDAAIAKAIISLGKSLNMRLIAEGVETIEQKEFVVSNGCENIQGYYYSKPLPAEEITKLLKL